MNGQESSEKEKVTQELFLRYLDLDAIYKCRIFCLQHLMFTIY